MTCSHVSLFSDCCGGQNRNKFLSLALLYAVQNSPSLRIIDQKFLETGHTEMEVDFMHSAIERAKKNIKINVPDQWENVILAARPKAPFQVTIFDYKVLSKIIGAVPSLNTAGEKINFLKIHWLRYRKDNPRSILYKEDFAEDGFKEMKLVAPRIGRNSQSETLKVEPAYGRKLPISVEKKKDLMKIVRDGIIPGHYAAFYSDIPTVNEPDLLPELDVEDSDIEGN